MAQAIRHRPNTGGLPGEPGGRSLTDAASLAIAAMVMTGISEPHRLPQ
jgi:hypothetical protein